MTVHVKDTEALSKFLPQASNQSLEGEYISPTLRAAILMIALEGTENLQQIQTEQELINYEASIPHIEKYDVTQEGDTTNVTLWIKIGGELVKEKISISPYSITINESITGTNPNGDPINLTVNETISRGLSNANISIKVTGKIGKQEINEDESIEIDNTYVCGDNYGNVESSEVKIHYKGVTKTLSNGRVIDSTTEEVNGDYKNDGNYGKTLSGKLTTKEVLKGVNSDGTPFTDRLNFTTDFENTFNTSDYHLGLINLMHYFLKNNPLEQFFSELGLPQVANPLEMSMPLVGNVDYPGYGWYAPEFYADASEIKNEINEMVKEGDLTSSENYLSTIASIQKKIDHMKSPKSSEKSNKLLQKMLQELLNTYKTENSSTSTSQTQPKSTSSPSTFLSTETAA